MRSCSHVILPKELAKTLPKSRLLSETEWRGIGVQQSRGWAHYAIHRYVGIGRYHS
jgi:cyclin-dependent kinase regulatory subunit CKS1